LSWIYASQSNIARIQKYESGLLCTMRTVGRYWFLLEDVRIAFLSEGNGGVEMFDIRKIQEAALYGAVERASSTEIAQKIVYGLDDAARKDDDPTWVKDTMKRLEDHFDKLSLAAVRMQCQCGYGMGEKLALVRELVESSSSIEELSGLEKAKAAGLFCENGELHLQFLFCPCPMLAEVDRLESDTWCLCTTGYSKVLFEQAFGCGVDVELLSSIKMGAGRCLMKIIPTGDVLGWKR